MKKSISMKKNAGVTLLEIMLVLAIAAMVIVMSVRFYKTAGNSQGVNTVMQSVNAITAAADSLAQGTSSYAALTTATVTTVVGASNMNTPYGAVTIAASPTATTYGVTFAGVPQAICTIVSANLAGNTRITPSACAAAGGFTYTYDSTK